MLKAVNTLQYALENIVGRILEIFLLVYCQSAEEINTSLCKCEA